MKKNKLIGMDFTVIFDRPVKKNEHYISPGQYGIICSDEELIFDFQEFSGEIDRKDPTKVHMKVRELDTRAFPDSLLINPRVMRESDWSEFFIFTGDDMDPELNALKVVGISAYFQNGETVQLEDVDIKELEMEE